MTEEVYLHCEHVYIHQYYLMHWFEFQVSFVGVCIFIMYSQETRRCIFAPRKNVTYGPSMLYNKEQFYRS